MDSVEDRYETFGVCCGRKKITLQRQWQLRRSEGLPFSRRGCLFYGGVSGGRKRAGDGVTKKVTFFRRSRHDVLEKCF